MLINCKWVLDMSAWLVVTAVLIRVCIRRLVSLVDVIARTYASGSMCSKSVTMIHKLQRQRNVTEAFASGEWCLLLPGTGRWSERCGYT